MMGLVRLDDLHPDGIRIVVDWSRFTPGSSIFVPCLNVELCDKQVSAIAARKKWRISTKIWVDHNRLGLRVWRIT